ncbi:MAG: ABC transporter ATP-binding protein [Gemmatimonadota bacterium]
MTATILVRGLTKCFGRVRALSGIDLAIPGGRVTAVVGPNAAGKSTLIKCLLGLVRPDQGEMFVQGERVTADPAYRRRIGYMPQAARFPENLTGREVLDLLAELRDNPPDPDDELIGRLDLEASLDKPVRTLSGGTRQKLSAVVAFRFRPSVLILDEPTASLDPVASAELKDRIRQAAGAGATVLLTSHVMAEVEELADEMVFMVEGRIRFHGTLDQLRLATHERKIERAVARLLREDLPGRVA